MRTRNLSKLNLSALFSIVIVLISCSPSGSKKNDEIQINYRSPLSVWLKITEVSQTLSESDTPIRGAFFPWIGNASLRWEVEVPEKDDYEVYLTANVSDIGDGKNITVEAGGRQADFTIHKTSGPFPGGENFKFQEKLNFERKNCQVPFH